MKALAYFLSALFFLVTAVTLIAADSHEMSASVAVAPVMIAVVLLAKGLWAKS